MYWKPKYWPAWILLGWLRLLAAIPLPLAVRSHKAIGRFAWRHLPRHRRIIERNLEIWFPEMDASEVEALARKNLENPGASVAELALAW